MAKKIVISFESDAVRVVYSSAKRGSLVVQNTLVFPKEELDAFLKKEKIKEFTVVCDFETFFSDVVYMPPVKGKYFLTILQAEIKKTFTELQDFSFVYTVLGESVFKGKKKQEVFIFAVNNSDIYTIVNQFTRHGKRITHLIPSIITLAQSVQDSNEPVLCLTKSGINKYLFLLKEGKMFFIRSAQGIDSGLHDFDVENINMTINHCRQSLKIDPSQVILIGSACFEYDAKVGPIAPLICLDYRPMVLASKDTIINFMSPIVCVQAEKQFKNFLTTNDILPHKYKVLHITKTVISYVATLLLILFILGSGYTAFNIMKLLELKESVEMERASMKNMQAIKSEYDSKKAELQRLMPLINFVNNMNAEPDYQKLLFVITKLSLQNIKINDISMSHKESALNFTVKGFIDAEGFTKTRIIYQNFLDSMKKINGMEMTSKKLEIQDKTFSVTATYKSKDKAD